MMFRYCFFDFDGTLADTEEDIRDAYIEGFKQLDTPLPEDFAETFKVGPTLENTVRGILPEIGEDELERFVSCFKECYDTAGFPKTRLYDGVLPMLEAFRRENITMFIASNKRLKPTQMLLEKLNVRDFFTEVLTPDAIAGVSLKKGAFLRAACERRQFDAADCVMIGDTALDMTAAREGRMASCAVFWGYGTRQSLLDAAPDFHAGHPRELLQLIGKAVPAI